MRKRKPKKRFIMPDPRYGDTMVTQFVNNMMWEGKKSVAFTLFYEAMDLIESKTSENPHEIWKKALANATPQVEVRSKRIGGANFQIPTEIFLSRAFRKYLILNKLTNLMNRLLDHFVRSIISVFQFPKLFFLNSTHILDIQRVVMIN